MDRKEAIRKYKETPTEAGVFRVHNRATGKSLVGSSTNLPAMLNRVKFQLEHGSYPNRELQRDWNESGAAAFTIEKLDTLERRDDPTYDPADDLAALEAMWREKIAESAALY